MADDQLPALVGRLPLLGLTDDQKLATIETGIEFQTFSAFASALGLEPVTLLRRLGVPERTLYRRLGGHPLSGQETERVLRIVDTYEVARLSLPTHEAAVEWLCAPERLERVALGISSLALRRELALAQPQEAIAARIPVPQLPVGFSITPWELDRTAGLPGAVSVHCVLTLNGTAGSASTTVRIAPAVDLDDLGLRRLVYDHVMVAIHGLCRDTLTIRLPDRL